MTIIDTTSISDQIQTVLFKPNRSITTQSGAPITSTIIANVTIEEDMHDELQITDHPVEGTNSGTTFISDHAFKRPVELVVRMGFANSILSSLTSNGVISDINTIAADGISANNSVAQYNALRALQDSRSLLTIVTGKRTYNNMLLQGLSVVTDVRSETSLLATCRFRQVIIVNTEVIQVSTPDNYTMPTNILGSQQQASGSNINSASAANVIGGGNSSGITITPMGSTQ